MYSVVSSLDLRTMNTFSYAIITLPILASKSSAVSYFDVTKSEGYDRRMSTWLFPKARLLLIEY